MDDRKIFECIAKKQPGVRAVQISDLLNVDLAEVSEALRELVASGELVRSAGFAPNGTAAQLYDFSPSFKASNDYKAVMAAMPAPAAAAPVKAGEVPSRAERAVAYILKHGAATDDDLRTELVMRAGEYPSSILGHAVKSGKVTRVNNKWVPGDGRPVMDPPKADFNAPKASIRRVAPVAVPSFLGTRVEAPAKPDGGTGVPKKRADVAPVVEVPAAAQPLRCAIWSDGMVELQSDGRTVVTLARHEAEFIARFMVMQVAA